MTSVNFKSFKKERPPVFFTLGDAPEDRYDCYPALSLPVLQEIALIGANFDINNAVKSFADFFGAVMPEEAARRIAHKMEFDRVDPIDKEQALEIMNWLLEVYGLRPTQPSSDTSAGSPTDGSGSDSTAGA
jgi:hypothetical protein